MLEASTYTDSPRHSQYEDRHSLYRIEQELGTQLQPIPAFIDPSLYVAPSGVPGHSAEDNVRARQQFQQQQFQQQQQQQQQALLPPSGNLNTMRAPQVRANVNNGQPQ
jgi:ATP-dependent RNA helicase DDX6/DHH1